MSHLESPATTVAEWTATLLWEACRREPRADSVRRALAGGADLAWAASAAADHRISPLLWRALGTSGSLDALGTDRAALGGITEALKMEALLLLPRAVALAVRPLTYAGLEPVVFKGPAVAARYPEPGLRPMDDIDLLLPEADHRSALDALGRAGWQVARAGGGDHYDTLLTHCEVPSLFLELHYGLEHASHRVTALDPDTLWALRQPLECAGTPAFGLPPAEELVVLAAHAGKLYHSFRRLVWIADLAMIVGAAASDGTAIDWDHVHAVAEAARCVTVVGAALAMARRSGVDAPAVLFPLPTWGWRGDAVRRLLSVTWPLTHLELSSTQVSYALIDARSQRAKFLFVLLTSGHGLRPRVRRMYYLLRRALARPQPRATPPEGLVPAQNPGKTARSVSSAGGVTGEGRGVARVEPAIDEPAEGLGGQHQIGVRPALAGDERQRDGEVPCRI